MSPTHEADGGERVHTTLDALQPPVNLVKQRDEMLKLTTGHAFEHRSGGQSGTGAAYAAISAAARQGVLRGRKTPGLERQGVPTLSPS